MIQTFGNSKARRIGRTLSGYPLKLAMTGLALVLASSLWSDSLSWSVSLEIVTVTAVLHALIYLQCGLYDRVRPADDATALLNNFKSEIKYVLGFLAYLYLFNSQFGKPFVITYLTLNTILQSIPVITQQWIGRIASRFRERAFLRASDLPCERVGSDSFETPPGRRA